MNRQIKFRVWDKVNERMLNIETLCLSFSPNAVLTSIYTYGPDFSNDPEVIGHDEPDLDDVTIEQYTGLDDKNGKPIYEGDVLENPKYRSVVKFGSGSFYADVIGAVNRFPLAGEWQTSVVIGNAHSNPELLEAQHD